MRMVISGSSNKQGAWVVSDREGACFLLTCLLEKHQEYSDISLYKKKLNLGESILPKCQLLKSK